MPPSTGEVEVTPPVLQPVANTTHPAVATDCNDIQAAAAELFGVR